MGFLDSAKEKLESWMNGDQNPLSSVSDQSQEDQDLCAFVRQKLDERRSSSSRQTNEAIWLTNAAYLCGIDSVEFDTNSRSFRPVNTLPQFVNRFRVHVNKVLPTVQNRLAKLCKKPPRWDVRPKSSDDEDKEAARLAKAVILNDWEYLKIGQKRPDLLMWAMQCGHAYVKVSWDQSLGPKDIKKYTDESGKECVELVTMGEKRVDIASAFECFPDPLAKTFDECNDFIQAKVRPLSYFRDHYENGHLVKEEDTWLNSLTYESRINAFNNFGGGQANPQPLKNTAIEINYYEKPSKKHPMGRHVITANGALLKDGVLPVDEIPFAKFDDIKVAGKYDSEAVITHIRSPQDQYNRNKTLKAAYINRTLMGKYIAARGHGLGAESLNDQSGEVVEYDHLPGAAEPHALDAPQLPQYVFQEDESLIGDINDVSGISQTSRGQVESASMPALGMQMLIEQDDTRIGIETDQHEYSYADVGRLLLKFTAKYYKDERLLKEVGNNFDYIVKKFKGDELRDNFDVHVVKGSTTPGSKTLERQNIVTLHQQGYLGKPDDPRVLENVLSMLEFGDEFEPWKKHSLIMASIQKGISLIEERSLAPEVSEFDNHPMWIQELDDYRLSDRFQRLSDEQKKLVYTCMEEHTTELQRMIAPATMEDQTKAPDLVETDAATQMEQQFEAENGPPPPVEPPAMPTEPQQPEQEVMQ